MSELPNGWANVTLSDVLISVVGGGTPPRNVPAYFEGNIPWFTVKDMKVLKPSDAEEHISEEAIANCATNLIPANTLIIATRIALGRAMRPTVNCAINQDLKALLLGHGISPDFLLYWVGSNERVIQDLGSGTTVSGIRLEALHGLPLLLPPAAEQTRIVAKLEELLSDLDAGVAELKAAQKKLAQYRQSLLKAAVEGALTADWRAARAPLPLGGGGAGEEGANPLRQSGGDDPTPPLPNPSPARGEGLNTDDQIWLANRARELRRDQTPDEQALWHQLRGKRFAGYKFRRQQVLGRFIVDFVCFAQRVIVELDGGQHATAAERDRARDEWLGQQGFRVLRFWNNEWSSQPEGVLEAIWLALQQEPPLPNPSPARGEGLHTAAADHSPSVGPKAPLPLDGGGAGEEGANPLRQSGGDDPTPPLPNPSPARGEGLHTAAADHSSSVGPKAPLPPGGGGAGGEGANPIRQSGGDDPTPPLPNPSPARGEGLHTAASDHSPSVGPKAPLPLDGGGAGGEGETGAQLLERILTERRARWEAKQLAKFKEQGKSPPKDWQKKYPEPVKPDTSDLPELPEGWVWATIDQIAQVGTGVTPLRSKSAYFNEGTVPWVTSGALNSETVTSANELVTELALKECRLELYPVGALLVAMYGEGKTRGKCSELLISASINQAIAAIVLEPSAQPSKAYLKAFLLDSYERMRSQASGGVQPNLNLQIIKAIVLPLPPHSEQIEITQQLDIQFEQISQQQVAVDLSLKQSTAQRQNILRAAFSGQLVAQDPNDEPASALLERIRAERVQRDAVKKPRGQGKINQDQP